VDSYERERNLDTVLDFLTGNFDSFIYIMEADAEQRYTVKNAKRRIKYHFVKDNNPVFHQTYYRNLLYQQIQTPIIAGWDADVLVPPEQIAETVRQIECGNAVIGVPYSGYAYQTTPEQAELFRVTQKTDDWMQDIHGMNSIYGSLSVGGVFITSRKEYLQSGGENEDFLGWGMEDFERIKRMEILFPQFPVYQASGGLFHLWHPRYANSWYADKTSEIRAKEEFLKVCGMRPDELRVYVSQWAWLKRLCN
jgi:hypothetical protein